jgi:hypothetical protein
MTITLWRYAVAVGMLLLLWALRLSLVDSIPPFIDEAFIMNLGYRMLDTSPLYGASEGRLVFIWYLLAFQPHNGAAYFVTRAAVGLLVVLNAAGVAAIGRQLAGCRGGLLALVLFAASPYFLFFGAVVLADVMAVAFLTLAVAATLRPPTRWSAVLVGVALFFAVESKIAYLPYVLIPLLAVLPSPSGGRPLRLQLRWAVNSLLVFGVLFGGFTAVQYWRGYAPLDILLRGSGGDLGTLGDLIGQMVGRVGVIITIYAGYAGILATAVSLVLVGVHLWRRRWFLPLVLVIPGAAVLAAQQFFSRYVYAHIVIVVLIVAIELVRLSRLRYGRWLVRVGVVVWIGVVSVPFYAKLSLDPQRLPLSRDDYNEYFAADSAGMGLAEVATVLVDADAQQVIGLLANCQSLRYVAATTLNVQCPRISPTGADIPALTALVEAEQGAGTYVVLENSPYVPASVPGDIVFEIARPGGLTTLRVYDTGGS